LPPSGGAEEHYDAAQLWGNNDDEEIWLAFGLASSFVAPVMADASVITKHYEVTSTFKTGPNSSVVTSFDATFDPASTISDSNLTITNYTSTGGAPFATAGVSYTYRPAERSMWGNFPETRLLTVYGTYGSTNMAPNTDDFDIRFYIDGSGNIASSQGSTAYATASGGYYQGTQSAAASDPAPIVATPDPVAALPEPATWATMLLGFAMVAGTIRYRRRRVAVVFG
jgi:hypothetical protein